MTNTKLEAGVDLVDSMTTEELDQLVDYIRVVYKTKRAQKNARAQAALKVGDRVMLVGNYKPKYLTGLTGEVVEKKNTRVLVKLDGGPVGKFSTGKVLTTPGGLKVIL
jgi:hypothetical protein